MGVANVPSAAGGGIKSVQRGSAASSGNVTITAVDIAKSFVTVFGTASSGTVAASFDLGYSSVGSANNGGSNNSQTSTASGGSTNLVAAIVQGYLSNSTTLVVSGACRWEVVEFA